MVSFCGRQIKGMDWKYHEDWTRDKTLSMLENSKIRIQNNSEIIGDWQIH